MLEAAFVDRLEGKSLIMGSKFYYFMVYAHRLRGVLILDAYRGNLIHSGKYLKQKYIWYGESGQVGIFDKKNENLDKKNENQYVSIWGRVKSIN